MPRILLLNPTPDLTQKLSELGLGEVFAGRYVDSNFGGLELPPPKQWSLIIHCLAPDDEVRLLPIIPKNYLEETRAARVFFGWEPGVTRWGTYDSYDPFEVVASGPSYTKLRDFFHERLHLLRPGRLLHLYREEYVDFRYWSEGLEGVEIIGENPLHEVAAAIVSGHVKRLYLPMPKEPRNETLLPLVEHLLKRTLPKLFPEAYFDSYIPPRIIRLQEEQDAIREEAEQRLRELDGAIETEALYHAPFRPLPLLRDDALKDAVALALEALGFEIEDLDAEEKTQLDADLYAISGSTAGFVETKSSGTRNCSIDDLEDFDTNVILAAEQRGMPDFKLLIFNRQLNRQPTERNETFSAGVRREARVRGMCLATGEELLRLVFEVREGTLAHTEAAAKLLTLA